jgi:proteasome alpha subunit
MYVSPEQLMQDKADYARKGIARGKSIIAMEYADGVVFLAENPSATLHKVSEIYDRIGFAGVGKYNEYENLRIMGIRQADLKGYAYSREDVTARSLANLYSQILGQIFTEAMKPFEVEILLAEVHHDGGDVQLYHVMYDGTMTDEQGFVALGGQADALSTLLRERYSENLALDAALRLCAEALQTASKREIPSSQLEVGILDRTLGRRKFRRLATAEVDAARTAG